MDIQQTNKESLAAYVHIFKWEASRYKFNNDAAIIRIFLKGLKSAHTIATKVYEKGPQTLADTIKEVERLQAAQQITSTLLPTSLVNTMSSDNNKCYQCQETGHMAHYCPYIRCFDCDKYGHVTVDCLDTIPPSGTPACCRSNTTSRCDRSSSRHHSHTRCSCHDYKDRHRFSHSQSHSHNHVYRSSSHHDSHQSCSRSFQRPSCHNYSCHRSSSSYCYCHDTPHCRSLSCRNLPKMTAVLNHTNLTDNTTTQHVDLPQVCKQCLGKIRTENTNRLQLTTPPSEYYSSDDQDSDSEDDLN